MLFTGVAYAMGGSPGGGTGGLMGLLPILLMFVIFYFLLIRPQQKQARKHQDFIKNLKVGDRVVTTGGLHGEVKGLTETTVTLASGLANTQHTLQISGSATTPIAALRVYRPPLLGESSP